jgi:hypothetical protein
MPDGGSGMTTADANALISKLDSVQRRDYETLAKRVDAINAKTRQGLVDDGLEEAGTIKAWESAYKFYVPLHREDVGQGPGIGQGFSVKGSASKRATGSKKAVTDILANVAMQRERAIVRAEKNRVATALVGLAKANENADFWTVDQPPKIKYVDERTGMVTEATDPLYRNRENVVTARVRGEDGKVAEHSVLFDEHDERAMRMAQALKNLDTDELGAVLGATARVTRYLASVNTQYSPVFGVVNLTRDTQGALFNLSNTPLRGKQAEVLKNILPALRGVYIDLRDSRKGIETRSVWAQLWDEFQSEGGQTGYRDLFRTSKDRAKAIERELKRASEGKAKMFGRAVFDWLSDYNSAMENSVRLAAYKVAKESGMTSQQAASLAKNLTVNFNRKGQTAMQAGALYAFFNASVQGTARLSETLKGPAGKKILVGGLVLGAVQALILAAAGFGPEEPPQFVRERNLVLPLGDKRYFSLPMPLGLHVVPNVSRVLTEFVLGGFRDPADRISQLLGVFADAFNPVGSAGWSIQTVAPSAIDPFVALAENKDWNGRPIAKPNQNPLAPTPGHTRAKDVSSWFGKTISQTLNMLTGGTQYTAGLLSPTPDQIDFLIAQAGGGVAREGVKVLQSADSLRTGEELPTHKLPLLGRFYGSAEGQAPVANVFYSNVKRLNEHEAEIKGRAKDRGDVAGYMAENPEARLYQIANTIERQVSDLRKRKHDLTERNASQESVKMIESMITQTMKRLNDRVNAVRGQ